MAFVFVCFDCAHVGVFMMWPYYTIIVHLRSGPQALAYTVRNSDSRSLHNAIEVKATPLLTSDAAEIEQLSLYDETSNNTNEDNVFFFIKWGAAAVFLGITMILFLPVFVVVSICSSPKDVRRWCFALIFCAVFGLMYGVSYNSPDLSHQEALIWSYFVSNFMLLICAAPAYSEFARGDYV